MRCAFCQNWTISQRFDDRGNGWSAGKVVNTARASGCGAIAYTYNEPLVGFEFVVECSKLAAEAGLANVLVTNGYVQERPAAELLPLVDALNVDVKSMEDSFYRAYCGGTLEPVLRFAEAARGAGCHLEITNLLIPGLNDSPDGVRALADWIASRLGPATPLHLSAYHPDHKLDIAATPVETLHNAWTECRTRLDYVYLGNIASERGRDTTCPGCGRTLVRRRGYSSVVTGIANARCEECGREADVLLGPEPNSSG